MYDNIILILTSVAWGMVGGAIFSLPFYSFLIYRFKKGSRYHDRCRRM